MARSWGTTDNQSLSFPVQALWSGYTPLWAVGGPRGWSANHVDRVLCEAREVLDTRALGRVQVASKAVVPLAGGGGCC